MPTVQVKVNPLVVRMSEDEIHEARETRQGLCLECGGLV